MLTSRNRSYGIGLLVIAFVPMLVVASYVVLSIAHEIKKSFNSALREGDGQLAPAAAPSDAGSAEAATSISQTKDRGAEGTDVEAKFIMPLPPFPCSITRRPAKHLTIFPHQAPKLDEVRIRKSSKTTGVRMEEDGAAQAAAGRAHATWEQERAGSGKNLEKSPSGKELQRLPSG
jgi:hypothetical protein